MIVVVVGPEKAGKTTLCREMVRQATLKGQEVDYQHRTGKEPFSKADSMVLMHHDEPRHLSLYDRAWPCAAIYSMLGFPQLPCAIGAEGERSIGKFIRAGRGQTLMLLGPSAVALQNLRSEDDLPVPAETEREAYRRYGLKHGWRIVENSHDEGYVRLLAAELLAAPMNLRTGELYATSR